MNNNSNMSELEIFNAHLIKVGTVTITAGIIANFTPAVYIYLRYGIIPSFSMMWQIWLLVAAANAVSWVAQPLSFFPILGTSGTYISWLAGNVADIRTPASVMAQRTAGVNTGTVEGDMISTIGIATSVFVSVTIISFFALVGGKYIYMLPPFVQSSFAYILPTVFAGVYADLTQRNIKFGIIIITFTFIVQFIGDILKLDSLITTTVAVGGGMYLGYLFYKYEQRNKGK